MKRRDFLKLSGLFFLGLFLPSGCGASPDLPTDLAIYYGYPSRVNGKTSVEDAIREFYGFENIILGDGLHLPGHEEHENSVIMIRKLVAQGSNVFGYVNLGCEPKPDIDYVLEQVDAWGDMGASGVFYDCVGPSYLEAQTAMVAAEAAREQHLLLFMNAERPRWVIEAAGLTSQDSILLEPVFLMEGETYRYPYLGELAWAVDKVKAYGVATYDPGSSLEMKVRQAASVREQAANAGLAGIAVTNSLYSASGAEQNWILKVGE